MADPRERLIALIDDIQQNGVVYTPSQMDERYGTTKQISNSEVADHLISNGVTVFPCKPGDPVWFVGTSNTNRLKAGVIETTVEKLILKSGGIYMKLSCNAMYETSCRSIGKSVFFSKEEAEAALARLLEVGA